MSPTQVKLLLFGLGALVLIVGLSAFRSGYKAVRLALFELPHWEQVPAVVVDTRLIERQGGTTQGGPRSATVTEYRPVVTYAYEYGGKEYRSDRFRLLETYGEDRLAQQAVLDGYPVGKEIVAYVNPDDPDEAVVDKEDLETPTALAIFGAFFALIGAGVLVTAVIITLRPPKTR